MAVNEPATVYLPPAPGFGEMSNPGQSDLVDPLGNFVIDTGADSIGNNFIVDTLLNFIIDTFNNFLVDPGTLTFGAQNQIVDTGYLLTPLAVTIYGENDAE